MDMTFPFRSRREAFAIARDRRQRQRAAAEDARHRAIARVERAVDLDGIPFFGVADVFDLDVVVLAPEERDGIELLAAAEHVERRHLSLAFSDHPVLDADS